MPSVAFTLNGRQVTTEFDDGEHLLEVLRERLGITTIKDGCAPQGVCGCCTMLLDGRILASLVADGLAALGERIAPDVGGAERFFALTGIDVFACPACKTGRLVRGLLDDRPPRHRSEQRACVTQFDTS